MSRTDIGCRHVNNCRANEKGALWPLDRFRL